MFSNDALLRELGEAAEPDQSDSQQSQGEYAPMSPYADAPSAEEEAAAKAEEKKQKEAERERQFLKAVHQVSSSETDEASASGTSGSELGATRGGFGGKRSTRKRPAPAKKADPRAVLQPVKETSSKKSKVRYFKGMQVMSGSESATGILSPSKHDMSDSDTSTARKKELDAEQRLPPNYQRYARATPTMQSSSEGSSADEDDDFEQQRAAARRGGTRPGTAASAKKTESEKEAAF